MEAWFTVTPAWRTSSGSRGWAKDTRFCTFTWLMSRLLPLAKATVMLLVPSAPLVEVRNSMFSTPLICCSSTLVTPCSTLTASAPT